MTSFGKICTQSLLKVGVNRQFQAKMPKYENRTISKTVNPIKPKFEDKAETTTCTSWMGYHYPKPNSTWLTAAMLKIAMTSKLCRRWSEIWYADGKPQFWVTVMKPELEFQYGGCLFWRTGSSNISAVDWDIWSKFVMPTALDVLKSQTWPNQKPKVDLQAMSANL